MTAQIPEKIRYLDTDYEIAAIENKWPFNPADYGFEPVMMHTACYRGFHSLYLIEEDRLVLHRLTINLETEAQKWQGVEPEEEGFVVYKDVGLPITYTGGVIIGDGMLREFYDHMGYQYPYCYEEVKELRLEEGELLEVIDHSEKMEEIRKEVRKKSSQGYKGKELLQYIDDAFALSYEKKWFKG